MSRETASTRRTRPRCSVLGIALLVAALCGCAPSRSGLPTVLLEVARLPQPTQSSAGPTSLRMILAFHGMAVPHDEMLEVLPLDPEDGARGPQIGLAALRCGFQVTIIPYERCILRPQWSTLPPATLLEHLERVGLDGSDAGPRGEGVLARIYADYLRAGGELRFAPLSRELLVSYLQQHTPLIAALDAEYLYAASTAADHEAGPRQAHFLVVGGYDAATDEFAVSDPWYDIPLANTGGRYRIPSDRLVTAVLLGAEANDAELIAIRPR